MAGSTLLKSQQKLRKNNAMNSKMSFKFLKAT